MYDINKCRIENVTKFEWINTNRVISKFIITRWSIDNKSGTRSFVVMKYYIYTKNKARVL